MAEIVNFLSRVFTSSPMTQATGITRTGNPTPFATTSNNPFVTPQNSNPFANYGQNKPVAGGYFAGFRPHPL